MAYFSPFPSEGYLHEHGGPSQAKGSGEDQSHESSFPPFLPLRPLVSAVAHWRVPARKRKSIMFQQKSCQVNMDTDVAPPKEFQVSNVRNWAGGKLRAADVPGGWRISRHRHWTLKTGACRRDRNACGRDAVGVTRKLFGAPNAVARGSWVVVKALFSRLKSSSSSSQYSTSDYPSLHVR